MDSNIALHQSTRWLEEIASEDLQAARELELFAKQEYDEEIKKVLIDQSKEVRERAAAIISAVNHLKAAV